MSMGSNNRQEAASAANRRARYEEMPARATLADLVGMESVVDEINHGIVSPFCYPEIARVIHLEAPKAVLISGPPGTGKTKLAEAIVSAIREKGTNVKFYVENGRCISPRLGVTERRIRKLFKLASENQPAVILLDQLAWGPVVGALRWELNNRVERGEVMVIATTNHKKDVFDLDPGLKWRFCFKLDIPLPDAVSRREIFELYIEKKGLRIAENDLQFITSRSEGMSGAALERLISVIVPNLPRVERQALQEAFRHCEFLESARPQSQ